MVTICYMLCMLNSDTSKSWDMSEAPDSVGGKVALSFPTFNSKFNSAPKKPFTGIMSYQAIKGVMRIAGEWKINLFQKLKFYFQL